MNIPHADATAVQINMAGEIRRTTLFTVLLSSGTTPSKDSHKNKKHKLDFKISEYGYMNMCC